MNKIICGDALASLRSLPDGIVQTCCTSPPYFGLRDYGIDGQIGLEDTPEAYIARLVEVFREVKRVLKDDGTLWVNIGDSYAGSGNGGGTKSLLREEIIFHHRPTAKLSSSRYEYKPKDLIGIPWMLAFALRADGWYLRSDIIWAKSNCMPESVTDRPTKSHEYIFLLSKSERYYYDREAILEPAIKGDAHAGARNYAWIHDLGRIRSSQTEDERLAGRNKRSVWTVSTRAYEHAHFATFPPKLIEPCILAGTSPQACEHCGAPWERVTDRVLTQPGVTGGRTPYDANRPDGMTLRAGGFGGGSISTIGWQPTCSHDNTGSGKCVVLDPFCGAGTVPLVALQHHRQYIGIELNLDYVKLINERIETVQPVLWEIPA